MRPGGGCGSLGCGHLIPDLMISRLISGEAVINSHRHGTNQLAFTLHPTSAVGFGEYSLPAAAGVYRSACAGTRSTLRAFAWTIRRSPSWPV